MRARSDGTGQAATPEAGSEAARTAPTFAGAVVMGGTTSALDARAASKVRGGISAIAASVKAASA